MSKVLAFIRREARIWIKKSDFRTQVLNHYARPIRSVSTLIHLKMYKFALVGVAQWIEHGSEN